MAKSSLGQAFVVTTAGESHGPGQVAIIDGCPPGLPLSSEDFLFDMARRRPGQSAVVTQRNEADVVRILSGVFEGRTTGASIALAVDNTDAKTSDYSMLADRFRPGHADHAYFAKFGVRDHRGGGRASARETVMRVAAAVIAKKILRAAFDIQVVGYTLAIGDVTANVPNAEDITVEQVEANIVRCPDAAAAEKMIEAIESARKDRDSIGGIAQVVATNVPAGWGEPVFDKLGAELAKALFSIPAVVGVERGAGFAAARMRGSTHNDRYVMADGRVATTSNHHGGILGGISTGMPIVLRAALKPASSIPQPQETVTVDGESTSVTTTGRHDPCLVPRFVPVGEAMVALVLVDHYLRHRAQVG